MTERMTERHLTAEKAADNHRAEQMELTIKTRDEFHQLIAGLRDEVLRLWTTLTLIAAPVDNPPL